MKEVVIPEVRWHLEDFPLANGVALSILRLDMEDIVGSSKFINIALNECFRRDGRRVGGVVSVSGGAAAIDIEELLRTPYVNENCLGITCSGGGHLAREELEALKNVALRLGLRTKKGAAIDFSKITSVAGIFEINVSTDSISYSSYIEDFQGKKILVVRFRGAYALGSSGADDAAFIALVLDLHCAQFDPDGIVVDFKQLNYEFGDDISISTYKFIDADAPSFAIVRDSQVAFFEGASIECYAISDGEALKKVVDRINEWTPSPPVSFLKDLGEH